MSIWKTHIAVVCLLAVYLVGCSEPPQPLAVSPQPLEAPTPVNLSKLSPAEAPTDSDIDESAKRSTSIQPSGKPIEEAESHEVKQSSDQERVESDVSNEDPVAEQNPAAIKLPEKEYLDAQLHKNNTLLVLAYQPDIRTDYLISTMRLYISDEQAKKAKAIALSYDWRYQEILDERAAILETASDEIDVKALLLELRKKTADLNAEVRGRIHKEILTREQRQKVKERYQQK